MSVWRMHESLRLVPVQREQTRTYGRTSEKTVIWLDSISMIHCCADHEKIINQLYFHRPILGGECTSGSGLCHVRQQNETSSSRKTLNETNTCADSLSNVHLNASVGMWNYYISYASGLEKLLSVCRAHATPETVPIQRDDKRTEKNVGRNCCTFQLPKYDTFQNWSTKRKL